MRVLGLPPKILSIIEARYSNTVSCVWVDGDTGDCFPTKSGVRQRCILAPDCFDVAMEWVLDRWTHRTMDGAILGLDAFTDVDYADGVILLSELLSTLLSAPAAVCRVGSPRTNDCQLEENESQSFRDSGAGSDNLWRADRRCDDIQLSRRLDQSIVSQSS